MIIKPSLVLKRWSFPIALLYLVALTYGSLSNVSGIPEIGFSFDDKIYHFLAYAILTVLLYNYLRTTHINHKIWVASGIAFIYGIIIEALQATVTSFRTPDYFDVIANTIGIVFVTLILFKFKDKLKLK